MVDAIVQALCNAEDSKTRALIAKQKTLKWSIDKMAHN